MKHERRSAEDWGPPCLHPGPVRARGLCNTCYSIRYRQLYPDAEIEYQRAKARNQRKRRLRKQGISLERYEEMVREQGGRCAICGEVPRRWNKRPVKYIEPLAFDVDHDHRTGRVRGLLCSVCNARVLPVVESLRHLIEPALAYLKR